MSTRSATMTSSLPLRVNLTCACPSVVASMAVTAAPTWKVMPRRLSEVRRRLAMSLSKRGSTSGAYSTTVTSAPKLRKMLANSSPMTPPPITQRWRGISVLSRRAVESTTCGIWAPGMGSERLWLPVAIMIWGAVRVCSPSAVLTLKVWSSTKRAVPSKRVMPGVRISD